ncbi:MAG: prepilin-type N-terminal cleavage/methylation domain-containing protein [Pseudomonadota bacterium]
MKQKGFTLLELLIGLGLSSVVLFFGTSLFLSQEKERKKQETTNVTFSMTRQFLDLRRKISQRLRKEVSLIPFKQNRYINLLSFTACNPGTSSCQQTFSSINFSAQAAECDEVRENISVECVTKTPSVPVIDMGAFPEDAKGGFSDCVPAECKLVNNQLGTQNALPRIRITRQIPRRGSDGTCLVDGSGNKIFQESVSFFPSGNANSSNDGSLVNPIVAASLCILPPVNALPPTPDPIKNCGPTSPLSPLPPLPPPADDTQTYCIDCERNVEDYPPNQQQNRIQLCQPKFRDFNLTLFAISRFGEKHFELVKQVANFPNSKLDTSSGIQFLGQIPPKR